MWYQDHNGLPWTANPLALRHGCRIAARMHGRAAYIVCDQPPAFQRAITYTACLRRTGYIHLQPIDHFFYLDKLIQLIYYDTIRCLM